MSRKKAERFVDSGQKVEQEKRYRSPIPLEREMLGASKVRQMTLMEAFEREYDIEEAQISMFGLGELSTLQLRAISAIQIRLEETNFLGDKPNNSLQSNFEPGKLPLLAYNKAEFTELCGAERSSGGRFSRKEEEDLLEALESLNQNFYLSYERKFKNKKGKYERSIVTFCQPLVRVAYEYHDVSDEEAKLARRGSKIPNKRLRHILVEPSHIFLEGIANRVIEEYQYYIKKPVELYRQIADYKKTKGQRGGVAPSELRFINWLLTQNQQPTPVSLEKLTEKIGLYTWIETRQKSRLRDKKIPALIDMALDIGFLLDWEYEPNWDGYIFTLNPDRAGRELKPHPTWKRGKKPEDSDEENES